MGMAGEEGRAHHHDWDGLSGVEIDVVVSSMSARRSTPVELSWCSEMVLGEEF